MSTTEGQPAAARLGATPLGRAPGGGVLVIGADGSVRACDAGAERLLGRPAADLVGRSPLDGGGGPIGARERAALAALARGEPAELTLRVRPPAMPRRLVALRGHPVRDAQGRPAGAVAVLAAEGEAGDAAARRLLGAAPDLITRHDAAGTVLSASAAARDLLGVAPEELAGRSLAELVHPDDAAGLYALRASMLGMEDGARLSARLSHRDGRPVWVDTVVRVLRDADGRVEEVVASSRPGETRAATGARLHAAERLLAETMVLLEPIRDAAGLPVGLRVHDAGGRAAAMLGLAQGRAAGTVLSDVLPPDLAGALLREAARVLGGAPSRPREMHVSGGGDGSWWSYELMPLDGGRLALALGSASARRSGDARLLRFGRVLDRSRDELYVFDGVSFRIAQVNRSASAKTGWEAAELVGRSWLELMPELSARQLEDIVEPLRDGVIERVGFETLHRRRDGSTYPVEVRMQRVEEESPPLVVAIVQDISARHAADQELRGREAENRRLAREQGSLRRVATAVAREGDPEPVFSLVCEEAARLIGAGGGTLLRFEAEGPATVVGAWPRPARVPEGPPAAAEGAAARVQATGRPAASEGSAAAPVRAGDRLWGVVTVRAGAVPLPPDATERLGRFAELVGLAVSNAEARARLAALAATDHLTGLANHRMFQERLAEEVTRARRHGRGLSLALIDLDHFKRVNDAHGHQIGDALMRETARRLAGLARVGDLVARIGGDEFAWLMPETSGMDAWRAADRARAAVAAEPFPAIGHMTISVGVCDLGQAAEPGELFRLADGALYWSKQHGRDVAFLYSPDVVEVLSDAEQAERLTRLQALQSIRVLARAVDAKDPSTRQHSERVGDLAQAIAGEAGWAPDQAALLRDAGLVHDVGKIAVPDAILFKPDRLSQEEFARVKGHAHLGAEMVADVLSDAQVSWVRGHHERWDGRGYPDRLSGEGIPEGARILTLADSWDVMTTARPYGAPLTREEALAECRRCAGRQFWPRAVAALERLVAEGRLPGPR